MISGVGPRKKTVLFIPNKININIISIINEQDHLFFLECPRTGE